MKVVARAQGFTKEVTSSCAVFEYGPIDAPMNAAVSRIEGRYPDAHFALNEKCHELAYILDGEGFIETPEGRRLLRAGDLVMINPGDLYAWEGSMTLYMVCTPPWDAGQHKNVA